MASSRRVAPSSRSTSSHIREEGAYVETTVKASRSRHQRTSAPDRERANHMVKVTGREAPEYEPIEAGTYDAYVKEFEEADGSFGPQAMFTFEILNDEEYEDKTLRGYASLKEDEETGEYTCWPGTKLWDWITAMRGGDELGLDEDFELDDLVGLKCRIQVTVKPRKKDGKLANNITDVLAPKKRKAKAKKAAEPAPVEEELDEETEAEIDDLDL